MTNARSPAAEYLRFLAWVVGAAVLIALVGALPTRRLGGDEAIPAMIAGCAIGILASAAGGIPIARGRRTAETDPAEKLKVMMLSMALRLMVVVALGAAASLSGEFERVPLLLWIALGYVTLLAVDTWYAAKGF
jgi:integral membrane sensor domain MASE1